MTHTHLTSVLGRAIYSILVDAQGTLGLNSVLYGNQVMIPKAPAAVIIPGLKRRELAGVSAPGGRVDNWLTVYIDVHTSKVGDESTERMAIDELAEAIESKIHEDVTVGGIIIHGFVIQWDPGESNIQNGQFRTVRLTFLGRSKTYLSA